MNSRRDFLSLTAKGSAMTAIGAFLPGTASAQNSTGGSPMENTANGSNGHYRPPFKFGMGGVPLGNEFSVVTDKDAYAAIEAAWAAGVRYYDMAPWYGLGLAERRFGSFLHKKKRYEFIVSSKVGMLPKASKNAKNHQYFPFSPSPNDIVFDYTASGVRRS